MNWTAMLLCVIWICCTITACRTTDIDARGCAFVIALIATFMIGIGYLTLHAR